MHQNTKEETAYANKFIELHSHLDGAIDVDIALELAKLQNITLPTTNREELEKLLSVPEDCTSLDDFLGCFSLPGTLLQTKEGIIEGIKLVCDKMKSHNVVYAEIRFAPQKHKDKNLTQEDVINAALEGLKKTKLKANLILCLMRGEGNEKENDETLELARKFLKEDGGVVGLDLAGAEAQFKTSKYKDIFARAKAYNIPFTIHAGEADGPSSVKDAIEFGARRIGHGIRIYEDPNVMELVKNKNITLEVCPTSNKQTLAIEDMSKYPFMDYLQKGIKLTINTDDPAIERTNIAKEFKYMENTFGLTPEQEKMILLNSVNAAFTSNKVKEELKKELNL